jgi:hypothetical protein
VAARRPRAAAFRTVVGPVLAIAHCDDKVSPTYERNLDKALFALSGVVQSA